MANTFRTALLILISLLTLLRIWGIYIASKRFLKRKKTPIERP